VNTDRIEGGVKMTDYIIAGIIAALVLLYLVYALLKPEEF